MRELSGKVYNGNGSTGDADGEGVAKEGEWGSTLQKLKQTHLHYFLNHYFELLSI